ncbi:MAG TPA: pyridoxal phosphate-dependent aminotransferase [Proteobacteria bacterium]|nr:aspartate aminotransferase [bacterium BMS3Abin14]HDL53907.1 pyridoxal phosphate-dependent aminotransferase [Pseudomonadota bacterium]
MSSEPSKRSLKLPPFIVMDVLEHAQELERGGRSIVHMEVGEPDLDTPSCIREAAIRALRDGETHYTHSLGLIKLREAICEHYHGRYGVSVGPDQVIVTSGTSPGLFLVFAALLEPGDEIVMTDPHYACYPNFVSFLGGSPVFTTVTAQGGYQLDLDDLGRKLGPGTRAILINSPGNPTGAVMPPETLAKVASLGPMVISDEIYHGLVYGDREHSILEYTSEAFVLNGFSKLYAMTGWRLGYVIVPKRFVRPMQKIQQNFFISAGSFVQWAGIAALKEGGEDARRMVEIYGERRNLLLKGLREIGFRIPVDPEGAFYVLVDTRRLDDNSYRLAFDILDQAGVAVTPGIDFGAAAEGHLRFSYTNSLANIREGLDRLGNYVRGKRI